ncbi:unnamed protein product [Cuscuta campestris]|uniref:Uncharacterized protein n=1 Tax=Cuscuta campestris TaxID=132261 RepID=A0A484N2Q4_9ASTE|nr:unnamed protein product [Cuscuta campestris]
MVLFLLVDQRQTRQATLIRMLQYPQRLQLHQVAIIKTIMKILILVGLQLLSTAVGSSSQVDLFGGSLVGNLLDTASVSSSSDKATVKNEQKEVDLFADAAFVTAITRSETGGEFSGSSGGH